MKENPLVRKHDAVLATLEEHELWVRKAARELDLDSEIDLAHQLSRIMAEFQQIHDFAGLSSNNIYWKTTDSPVRLIHVPCGNGFLTVVNPKYERVAGQAVNSTERCGSIPGFCYTVKRRSYVSISGYNLEKARMTLKYGSRSKALPNCNAWIIQHEMDHLDGVLIRDKAID